MTGLKSPHPSSSEIRAIMDREHDCDGEERRATRAYFTAVWQQVVKEIRDTCRVMAICDYNPCILWLGRNVEQTQGESSRVVGEKC